MPQDQTRVARVCLVCRRGLGAEEVCPSGEDPPLLSLDVAADRDLLREHAWAVVPKVKWLGTNWRLLFAFVGAGLGGLGGTAAGLASSEPMLALFLAMGGGLIGLLVFASLASFFPMPASFYARLPVGAERGCGKARERGERGRVVPADGTSPKGPLVSGLELVVRERQVTFRVGTAEALRIDLEDGRRIHVGAGPVELSGAAGTFEALDEGAARAESERLGGAPDSAFMEEDEGPIPAEAGHRWALVAGAVVELRSLTRVAPREAHGGAFRTAANRDLAPVGVVRLHALTHGRE